MCANFTISTVLSERLVSQGRVSVEGLKRPFNVQSQHAFRLQPRSSTAAAPLSGRASGKLNTHQVSNWIFNQAVSSLKWWTADPHINPCSPFIILQWDFRAFSNFCSLSWLKVPEATSKDEPLLSKNFIFPHVSCCVLVLFKHNVLYAAT